MCIFEHDPLRKEVAKEKVAEEKVAEQKVEEEKKRHQSKGYHKEKEKCRNGEHCSYYKNNMCMFEHDPTRKEEQKSKQERNHDNERPWEALKPTRRRWNGPNYRNDKRTPGHQKDDKERKLRDERQPRNDNHFLEEIVAQVLKIIREETRNKPRPLTTKTGSSKKENWRTTQRNN